MAFHIPSSQEFADLKSIMDGLSLTTGNDYKVKLHMPFAGNRSLSANLNSQGMDGNYWSSSPYGSADPDRAFYTCLFSSSSAGVTDTLRANANSVRCFKDEYVEPDNAWTVVAGTLGSAGIFYNATSGLISVTNGTDKNITMKDKNEGATVVYNDGDELTQANMGNLYQWGNYYGFPSTGSVSSISSTAVSTEGYGNDNPYSSSTYIDTFQDDWSSPHNDNLWAGSSDEYFEREGHTHITVSVYNKAGDTLIHTFDDVYSDSTISTLINSGSIPGVTALSTTINGTTLSTDTVLVDGTSYYDVTPVTPPTPTGAYITKVYHNNKEYTVGGVVVETEVSAEDVSYDNSSSGAVADNLQDAMDEVFQSVSNGKTLIAAAITDKGVSTAASDSFQTMASNIDSLEIATEAQKTAYGLAHGKDVLLFSIPLYTDHSSDGENLLLYNGIGFEDKEYYIIGKKTSYSSSEEYNFDIYEFYKNGTYNKTDINFDISKSDGNPPYIQWGNRYKISGDEQYRYFVYAKGYSYDHPPYGTYLRFDTQTGVLEKYTTEIPYNDAIIANERITLPYAIAYTTIDVSSGKVANIVARI